ncbi:hypothetical protein [Uliginosibacterium sediminicola]|uniref:DUF3990 domain-containing protein n=1 Tax=Uliginosibacterium sediminicola TaxID=2024550 RepID=A0ABU9YW56_9RHOO
MSANSRYEILPGLLLGFHGTDAKIAERVLAGHEHLTPSKNDYDWLGHGIYLWEYSPQRAEDFARQSAKEPKITKGKIETPAVVGVIIDPGLCLNMLEASALEQAALAYEALASNHPDKLPSNKGGADLRQRHLDCAVLQMLHTIRAAENLPSYDTVRGAFWEGDPIYPNAGFRAKNHVQICIRNTDCIKGYFRVISE